jgi:hypothetical protein
MHQQYRARSAKAPAPEVAMAAFCDADVLPEASYRRQVRGQDPKQRNNTLFLSESLPTI